jgi:hypothetical protein
MKHTNDMFQEDDITERKREKERDFVTSRQCFDIHIQVFVMVIKDLPAQKHLTYIKYL